MKKFFKFGKEKNKTPEPSPTLSKHGSVSVLCGYEIREKDLSKLHKAAWNGDLNKVKQLAKKDASPLDKQNRTPLHLACVKGFANVVTELLEWKAKPNLCDNDGKTPLLKAVECKNEECVKQLLEHKADPNVKDLAGESSLHYVVRDGSTNIMQVLLKSHNIIVDIRNKNGETPLHIAVKKRNLKMAELLLKHGADINAPNNNGETALMEATLDGATDVVKFLLENGADVNRKNKSGWTADDLASMEHQDDIRLILSKHIGHKTESHNEMAVGVSDDVIPPAPGMYGAPATNKEGDYSEIDVSKMSEATGGLDTWNDNTDDEESEIQLREKVPGLNLAKNLNQTKENKQDTVSSDVMVSARSAISEPSLVDGDWSDSDSVLSSACDTKKPVNKLRQNIQVIQEKDEKMNADDGDIKDNVSWDEESTVLSTSANDKGHNNNTQVPAVFEEPQNTKELDQKDGRSSGVPNEGSFPVNKDTIKATLSMDSIEDVSDPEFDEVQDLNVEHNTKVEPSGDSDDSNWDSTELSPHEDIPAIEDEDVLMPHEEHQFQGQNSPRSSLTKQEETPTADNAAVPAVDSPDEDSKWDSEESEAVEPPPLPTEAPPTSPPSASIHPEEDEDEVDADYVLRVQNDSHREQEQRHREWQTEMEQRQQQNEAVQEHKKEREEDFPVKLNQQEREIEVTKDTTVKNTQISRIERVVMEGQRSSRLNEQRQAVDKEIAELASQRQVSRMRESLDEEDTFNDLSEMESTKKTNVGYQLPAGVSTVPDDDCLSYSSTEHENSIHDECRSHQLVPISFSMSGDSTNVMRLQQQLRETQQKLEKERSARLSQENKRKSLDKDREELIQKLEDVSKAKSLLEQQKIDMEATIRNLQYQLKEETEKCKNFEVLYNKTKEQLSRKDDQFTQEVESKQKSDLSLRNLQMELHAAQSLIKQLEEEKNDLQQQLIHEKNARILQEQLNEEQIKFQNSINKTGKHTEEGVCAVDHSVCEAGNSIEKLNVELYATKMELERLRSHSRDDHDMLTAENDELRKKIDDLKATIKINEEALAHASLKYNMELTALNTEITKLTAVLESEKMTREKLESEVESLRTRLETTSAELAKAQEARNELERKGFSQQEDLSRLLEKQEQDLTHLQETNQNLLQRLSEAENKANKLETELHIANATLVERTNQLSTIQRELEQRCNNQRTLESELQKAKEENARLQAKLETLEERVTNLQAEVNNLRQQLDEAHVQAIGVGKEEGDRFTTVLSALREDHDRAGIDEYLRQLEEEKLSLEAKLKHEKHKVELLQEELDEFHKQSNGARRVDGMSQLEHDKHEIISLLEEEKNKTQKAMELKKKAENSLSAEQQRCAELQKEVALLKTHLKAAKKRLKSHLDNGLTDPSDLERLKAELEAKARLELNRKLEEVNIYLEEQARARDKLDQMRDINEAEMKKEFERSRNELLEDINRLRQSYAELLNQKEFGTDDAQRFKRLYETELQAREQLAKRLEKALKIQERAQMLIDRQNHSGSIYGPLLENGRAAGVKKPPMNHEMSDVLSAKLQRELDRSIAKHLEKGPHIDIMPPARTFDDSLLSMSSTPYKSSSDYMSVLKKNYFL